MKSLLSAAMRRVVIASLCLCAVSLGSFAGTIQDGPYVSRGLDGGWVARWVDGDEGTPRIREEKTAIGRDIEVRAVGNLPTFKVRLRQPAPVAADEVALRRTASLFVMADTHGEFEIAVELLKRQKIIDETLRWSFGKGHLIVLGDVFDRGPNQTEILWLIYKLEAEAKKARGGVHLVLGNHEHMILTGDIRYLNSKYVQTAQTLGLDSYSTLFAANTVLGQWLRTKPTVIKLNDLLCLHGGISPEVIERKLSLQEINSTVRNALNNTAAQERDERTSFVLSKLGPLWYRGYFADQKEFPIASSSDIDDIRKYYGVGRILVGHTIVPTITPLYEGKVIAVQVYPHRDEGSGAAVMEALRIERGRFYRARIDGSVEPLVPAAAGSALSFHKPIGYFPG